MTTMMSLCPPEKKKKKMTTMTRNVVDRKIFNLQWN